jgi:hypothetical protein
VVERREQKGYGGFFSFFRTIEGEDEWMSGRWAASRSTIGTVQVDGHPIPSITDLKF